MSRFAGYGGGTGAGSLVPQEPQKLAFIEMGYVRGHLVQRWISHGFKSARARDGAGVGGVEEEGGAGREGAEEVAGVGEGVAVGGEDGAGPGQQEAQWQQVV